MCIRERYFDKSVKELDYVESALLAALPKAPSKYNPFSSPDLAKTRRNLVLRNLKENGYISDSEFKQFSNSGIKLKNRKVFLIEEAKSYTEEVRRIVKTDYGFEKLYSQGLSISTPLNINYQIQALKSLRQGIQEYDRRHGWRGVITNKVKNKNWEKKVAQFKLDPTLNWKKAEITEINENFLVLKSEKNSNIRIYKSSLKWVIKSKEIKDIFEIGDFSTL